jgi:tRNA dimethylallyltransferase
LKKRVPVIVGPTAVGKSKLALEVALALGAEVVVADSRQVYRRLEIATNKPSREDRERVRYHGLDLADPAEGFNVHRYVEAVAPVLAAHDVVVEGGTNLYVDALMDGLSLGGVPPRPERRAELASLSTAELASLARSLDPELKLDFANRVRLVRAIEVLEVAGPPLARLRTSVQPAWDAARIGLEMPSEQLLARIEERSRQQLRRGLVEETRAALESGVPPSSQVLTGTGYAEAVDFIAGRIGEDELLPLMVRNNRRLAKRQLTWLRRDPRVRWFPAAPDPLPAILNYLETTLS